MQKVKKYLQYNLYELCLLLLIINSASYFFDKNYLLNSLSVLCGFLIYFTVDVYYFVSTSFFKSNNPSLILFKGISSTLIKYLILIFLLVIAFKYLSLNNCNYSEPYCPKIMSGVPSKAAFNALTAFMPFFFAVPM